MADEKPDESKLKRPEWMSSISGNVDPEEYLLGRKIDKTFELSQKEKEQRLRERRAQLIASNKLTLKNDPLLKLKDRKEFLIRALLANPSQMKRVKEELSRRSGSEHPRRDGRESSGSRRERSTSPSRHRDSSHRRRRDDDSRHRHHEDRDKHRHAHREPASSSRPRSVERARGERRR